MATDKEWMITNVFQSGLYRVEPRTNMCADIVDNRGRSAVTFICHPHAVTQAEIVCRIINDSIEACNAAISKEISK